MKADEDYYFRIEKIMLNSGEQGISKTELTKKTRSITAAQRNSVLSRLMYCGLIKQSANRYFLREKE